MLYTSNNTTRKILCSFMSFFTDISIQKLKTDPISGQIQHKLIRVPVMWASTEKWLQVLRSGTNRKGFDPALLAENPVEIEWMLPRIAVNLTGFTYDSQRHIGKSQKISQYSPSVSGSQANIFSPVPYNLDIELTAIAKNVNDVLQITEQIIPFFSPSLSLDMKLFPGRPSESIPIILQSVSPDINDEINQDDEYGRIFTVTFSFMVKANYYLPEKTGEIIKHVTFDTLIDPTITQFEQYVQNAVLANPVGEYSERTNEIKNPITTNISIVNI